MIKGTQSKFICSRAGNKLVWRKLPSSPKPKPSAIYISPLRDDISREIDRIRITAIASALDKPTAVTWAFQGATTEEIRNKTVRSLERALPTFSAFGFKNNDVLILIARDMNWVRDELTKRSCKFTSLLDRAGFYLEGPCPDGNGAITAFHWDVEKFSDGLDGLYFNHVLPHEYFHQIQQQLTKGGNGDFPKWFWEGSAQFFSIQAWTSWNQERGYVEWFEYWNNTLRPDLGPDACRDVTLVQLSDPSASGIANGCAYSKGQLVVEFLVARYGLEKYRELYTRSTPFVGVSQFPRVFEQVTGEKLYDFYVLAEAFIKKRGW